ncbi:tetratricopeptide repeat protein [Marilutibacter chinensis]|uniref:Tetratricopeptide repeat protein n=1 Tax=Marilutibacter chinensis TaxID=2912247 RepID=A0ABS9HUI8_9GAMM|nr:tetratricopeptide repeat protein [Lysobacter chinensis]MCF7222161.1 tetratricopeptide repeat protein [Lysobacter chinensis]
MPYLGLGLHVVVAVLFAIHAVRSGQDRYWLIILFMFPLLGSVVYALAIWLPEQRHSPQARALQRGVRQVIDPERELRLARAAFDDSPTTDSRMRLGDALLDCGRASEAIPHYQAALRGIHADDPDIQVKLARAQLESGHASEARELLDRLIAARPDYRSLDGHLTYARAVAATGERDKAREEFETLVGYSSSYEAVACYVEQLLEWDETAQATEVGEAALARAGRLPGYARKLQKPYLVRIRQALKRVPAIA